MNNHLNEMDLYEYIDDVLDPNQKIIVANHLSMCPTCRQKVADIKLMYYELDHLDSIEIPDALESIRLDVVASAFEGEKIPKYKALKASLKNKKEKVSSSFIGRQLAKQSERLSKTGKNIYVTSKRLIKILPEKNTSGLEKVKNKFSIRRLL